MSQGSHKNRKLPAIIRPINKALYVLFAYLWVMILAKSDSYYAPYVIVCAASVFCFARNSISGNITLSKYERVFTDLFAALYSLMTAMANYGTYHIKAWASFLNPAMQKAYTFLLFAVMLVGGFLVFEQILVYICCRFRDSQSSPEKPRGDRSRKVFLAAWAAIAACDCFWFFTMNYPGVLTPDSMFQVSQTLSGVYTNHHPYYHTLIIRVCLRLGNELFGSLGAGVAVYSVMQITVMSACFAYVCSTLQQMGVKIRYIVIVIVWYAVMPFHVIYSFTMWKDVLFGGAVAVFVVSMYRYLCSIGRSSGGNIAVMLLSGLGMCLWRSNGLFAFALTFIVFAVLFRKERRSRKPGFAMAAVLIVSFVLKHPALNALEVKQPDLIESLSVPAQQIARVITDYNDLDVQQRQLLEKVVDVDRVPETYLNYLSDPIKNLVRETDHQEYISENKVDFIKLYIQLALKHPLKYAEAWIDQTRGYWNGGYGYWRWSEGIYENDLGLAREIWAPELSQAYTFYQNFLPENPEGQIFVSIGFHVWLALLCLYAGIIRRDKRRLIVTVPLVMIVLSLLIATPVFCEFRYAYAIFCALPFILFSSFQKGAYENG